MLSIRKKWNFQLEKYKIIIMVKVLKKLEILTSDTIKCDVQTKKNENFS